MCGLIQREPRRIVGYISLVCLIGVIVCGILVEEGFGSRIYLALVEDCQREILIDQESGYIGGIMVCDRKIDPVAAC